MPLSNGLGNTLSIVDAVAATLGTDKERAAVHTVTGATRRIAVAGDSILSFASQTTILSRAFIDETIIDEIVIPNVLRSCREYYAAQIISALHLGQMVDNQRSVQDVLALVQDGHHARSRNLIGNVIARKMGIEAFMTNYLGESATESFDFAAAMGEEALGFHGPTSPGDTVKQAIKERDDAVGELDKIKSSGSSVSVKSVAPSEHNIGPMGELYEIKLSNPKIKGQSVTVPLFIQIQPSVVPAAIAPRFIDMNVAPTVWQRWTQMRSGEMTFWKDFLFGRDLARRQKSIIKDPAKAAAFADYLKTVAKKDAYAIGDISDRAGAHQSSNLANSVVIFSEDTLLQAKVDSGIDLHNSRDRQRYFHDSYTMMLVVIDPLHQRVTIYFNGIDGAIDSSYNDFKPKDSKFDPKDFMTALQAFNSNSLGRLR